MVHSRGPGDLARYRTLGPVHESWREPCADRVLVRPRVGAFSIRTRRRARYLACEQPLSGAVAGCDVAGRHARVLVPPSRPYSVLALAAARGSSHAGPTKRAQGSSASRLLLLGTWPDRLGAARSYWCAAQTRHLAVRRGSSGWNVGSRQHRLPYPGLRSPNLRHAGIPSHSPLDRCESRELQLFHGVPNLGHDLRHAHGSNVGRGARDGNRSRPHPAEISQRASITVHISPPRSEQARIGQVSPRYAAPIEPQPCSLAEIQRQVLDADTLRLEYSPGNRQVY